MPDANNNPPPPELVFPKDRKFKAPKGCTAYEEPALTLRYVTDKDWTAFTFNLLSATFAFVLIHILFRIKSTNPMLTIAIPLASIWIAIVYFHNHLWVNVDGLQAKIYVDMFFSKKMIVYLQGGHFTAWSSKDQTNDVDFQKHETIETDGTKEKTLNFQTQDGYQLAANVTIVYNRRAGIEAMSKSLKFKRTEEIRTLIKAWVQAKLSDLGGCNSYETIIYYKPSVTAWAANLFGGEGQISLLEQKTGTNVLNPVVNNLDLDEESKKTFNAKARLSVMREETKLLHDDCGVTSDEAFIGTQVALNLVQRVVSTQEYKGIPEGVTTFAPGNAGIAIGGGSKSK